MKSNLAGGFLKFFYLIVTSISISISIVSKTFSFVGSVVPDVFMVLSTTMISSIVLVTFSSVVLMAFSAVVTGPTAVSSGDFFAYLSGDGFAITLRCRVGLGRQKLAFFLLLFGNGIVLALNVFVLAVLFLLVIAVNHKE
jgi:hypothetical protein